MSARRPTLEKKWGETVISPPLLIAVNYLLTTAAGFAAALAPAAFTAATTAFSTATTGFFVSLITGTASAITLTTAGLSTTIFIFISHVIPSLISRKAIYLFSLGGWSGVTLISVQCCLRYD